MVVLGSCLSTDTVNGRCPNSKSPSTSRRLATASLHIDFYIKVDEAKDTQTVTKAFEHVDLLDRSVDV